MRPLHTLLDRLLDLLFPPRCAACGRSGQLLCAACRGGLRPYPRDDVPAGLDGATVACIYDRTIQRAIHHLKYLRQRRIAHPLGDLIYVALQLDPQPADAILAVPLHADRLAERGFNQSDELARHLAAHSGLPVLAGLERSRDTGHQAGLSRLKRGSNVAGAFVWRGSRPPPERVLLVDDVLTTGATLVACAEALRDAGAREVRAVAVARSQVHKLHRDAVIQ